MSKIDGLYMNQSPELSEELKRYLPLIEAVVKLFQPFVEVAVHDIERGELVALYHNISQRKIGEASPLKELASAIERFPDHFEPYYKTNWDGRKLKCTSITVRDPQGKPIGLICINVDTSFFQDVKRAFEAFLRTAPAAENPLEAFGGNTKEQLLAVIQEYLQKNSLNLNHLHRQQKKELVLHLYRKGVLNLKNAVPLIAEALKLSRASVYNYLKSLEES